MLLLGITGPIGHGKTTLADMLAKHEPSTVQTETSIIISEAVNQLNDFWNENPPTPDDLASVNAWLAHLPTILEHVAQKSFSLEQFTITQTDVEQHPDTYSKLWEYITDCQQDGSLISQPISAETKPRYRSILQWLGGYGVTKLDPGIWYDELLRRSQEAKNNGCQLYIVGGVRFLSDAERMHQAGGTILEITRPHTIEIDTEDPTERERATLPVDIRLSNDGSLEDLERKAVKVLNDLKAGNPQPNY